MEVAEGNIKAREKGRTQPRWDDCVKRDFRKMEQDERRGRGQLRRRKGGRGFTHIPGARSN